MNLDTMTAKQLREYRDRIDSVIADKQAKARLNLKAEFVVLARKHGFDLSDIIGRHVKAKAAAKFRDATSGLSWSGRGRMPKGFNRKRAVPV
jgi:DNA-binding protein H-NS